jgi:hypothetical protein
MTTFFKNRSTLIFVLLLLTMLILTWLFPSSRFMIEAAFILVSLALASLVVVGKNRESYQQGKLTRTAFMRRNILDVFGILLAMSSSGLLANYMGRIINVQMAGDLARFVVVIVISLLVGLAIGILVRRMSAALTGPPQPDKQAMI